VSRLSKRDVERLLTHYDEAPLDALSVALRKVLALPGARWELLVAHLPVSSEQRAAIEAAEPEALDALVAELNERRGFHGFT
jgi:hypothetical protein